MTATWSDQDKKVLAGIVLFNPDIRQLEKNIQALAPQTHEILLVDNSPNEMEEVVQLQNKYGIKRIANQANLGIAKALNQILNYAKENGYQWYLTMDQDSLVADNLTASLLEAVDEKTGIVCPFLLNNQKITMEEYQAMDLPFRQQITDPILCITSASLNRTEAAIEAGGYREDLFIDCVDVEFNIRMMEAGWQIIRCPKTWLVQEMGQGKPVKLMAALYKMTGKKAFQRLSVTPVYSPFRLYYIARNSRYVHHLYPTQSGRQMTPGWMMMQFAYYTLSYPLSSSRIEMWKAILKGWKDAKKMEEN